MAFEQWEKGHRELWDQAGLTFMLTRVDVKDCWDASRQEALEEAAKECFHAANEVAQETDYGYVAQRTGDRCAARIRQKKLGGGI